MPMSVVPMIMLFTDGKTHTSKTHWVNDVNTAMSSILFQQHWNINKYQFVNLHIL